MHLGLSGDRDKGWSSNVPVIALVAIRAVDIGYYSIVNYRCPLLFVRNNRGLYQWGSRLPAAAARPLLDEYL